jgi:hypothetical protein
VKLNEGIKTLKKPRTEGKRKKERESEDGV